MALGQSTAQLGVAAAARRYNKTAAASVGGQYGAYAGDAPWFQSPSTRIAKIREVAHRADILYYDMYQSHAPAALRDEYKTWMENFQKWVEGLTWGAMLLPATEEYAASANKQIEAYRKQYEGAIGRTVAMPSYRDITENVGAPPTPFPWKHLFVATAIVGGVVGIIYVGGKIPTPAKAAA